LTHGFRLEWLENDAPMDREAPSELKDLLSNVYWTLCYEDTPSSKEESLAQFDTAVSESLSGGDARTLKAMAAYLSEILPLEDADSRLEVLWRRATPSRMFVRARRRKGDDPPHVALFKRIYTIIEERRSRTTPPDAFKGFCVSFAVALGAESVAGPRLDGAIEDALEWCEAAELIALRDFLGFLLAQDNAAGRLEDLWRQLCPHSRIFAERVTAGREPAITRAFARVLQMAETRLR
jgi:hypothetical protein